MRICIVGLLLYAALAGCAQAQDPIEIADGRAERPWTDLSQWAAAPPVMQAVDAARSYWKQRDPSYEEEVRVMATTTGSFTQPDTEQQAVLYLMSLWPRCCPKTGLAILEGDKLIRNVAFESIVQDIWAIPDLNGDGRDELVFDGTFGMGGQNSRSVTFVAFGDEGFHDLGSTGINDSACAAGQEGSTAAHLTFVPGSEVMIEHYSQASCEGGTWEMVGEPEPLTLVPPEESPYVDITMK